jgi:Zn ribbon nucleic-acid-binding protein
MTEIGIEWISGNAFYPTRSAVVGLLRWEDLPPREQKSWMQIEYWTKDFAGRQFVALRVDGRKDLRFLPMEVFAATHTRANEVQPGEACPICGERDADRLLLDDDEATVVCQGCGYRYEINQQPEVV